MHVLNPKLDESFHIIPFFDEYCSTFKSHPILDDYDVNSNLDALISVLHYHPSLDDFDHHFLDD